MSTASAIATNFEVIFARAGFTEPGVAALREASGVTLRTLYRHFPSREAMVVGALRNRHNRYLEHLRTDPGDLEGSDAAVYLFDRVAKWMNGEAASGCLFAQALAAHPNSAAIKDEVTRYRAAVLDLMGERVRRAFPHAAQGDVARATDALFVVHEGQVQASVELGADRAWNGARQAAGDVLSALER